MALIGPSGGGKTYTALAIATCLGDKVAVIDTERGSASKYSHKFDFDVMELDSFEAQKYISGIEDAVSSGYDVLVIDSLSHGWTGKGGILELVENTQGNKFSNAWAKATPLQQKLVDAILTSPIHVIATMRAKMEYVIEQNENGKAVPKKVGLAPVQRNDMEYEFDVIGMVSEGVLTITKSRAEMLTDGVFKHAGKDVADILNAWLSDGEAYTPPPARPATDWDNTTLNDLMQEFGYSKLGELPWGVTKSDFREKINSLITSRGTTLRGLFEGVNAEGGEPDTE